MFEQILLMGFLGSDPTMRYLPSGKPVTSFSVATSRKWTGKDGEKKEQTTWWKVSVFGGQAESCNQYLHKGSPVLVTGTMRPDESGNPRTYERKDGTWAASYELNADNVRFLPQGKAEPEDDIVF